MRHPEENDLPPLVDGAEPDVRDFASNIKEAKRRNITKLQSTIEEVMNCPYCAFILQYVIIINSNVVT